MQDCLVDVKVQVQVVLDEVMVYLFEGELIDVMCYVCIGGKWLWVFLVLELVWLYGIVDVDVLFVVVVVEVLYVYLLVYDDLFVMDDDDLCCGLFIVYV